MRDAILIGLGALLGFVTASIDGSNLQRIAVALLLGVAIGVAIHIGDAIHNHYRFKTDIR